MAAKAMTATDFILLEKVGIGKMSETDRRLSFIGRRTGGRRDEFRGIQRRTFVGLNRIHIAGFLLKRKLGRLHLYYTVII